MQWSLATHFGAVLQSWGYRVEGQDQFYMDLVLLGIVVISAQALISNQALRIGAHQIGRIQVMGHR